MKKGFIWVSGLSFIDNKNLLMAIIFFGFLAKNKPVWVSGKTKNIPGTNWLTVSSSMKLKMYSKHQIGCLAVLCTWEEKSTIRHTSNLPMGVNHHGFVPFFLCNNSAMTSVNSRNFTSGRPLLTSRRNSMKPLSAGTQCLSSGMT